MPPATIEHPVINSPFVAPVEYFEITKEGPTGVRLPGRRPSTYVTPVPQPKKRASGTMQMFVEEREEENRLINELRSAVGIWRERGYPFTTQTTRMLHD